MSPLPNWVVAIAGATVHIVAKEVVGRMWQFGDIKENGSSTVGT